MFCMSLVSNAYDSVILACCISTTGEEKSPLGSICVSYGIHTSIVTCDASYLHKCRKQKLFDRTYY